MRRGTSGILETWRQQSESKLAAPLEERTREEKSTVIRFLGSWRFEAERGGLLRCTSIIRTAIPCIVNWSRMMGTLLPARGKDRQQGVVALFIDESKEVSYTSVGRKTTLTLLLDWKGLILEHYMPDVTTDNSEANCDLLESHLESDQNKSVCSFLVCCYNMITLGLTHDMYQMNKLQICYTSAFNILHFHPSSHHMIIMYWTPRWEARRRRSSVREKRLKRPRIFCHWVS